METEQMLASSYVVRTNHTVLLRSLFWLKQTQIFRTVDQRKGQSGIIYIWKYFEIFILAGYEEVISYLPVFELPSACSLRDVVCFEK